MNIAAIYDKYDLWGKVRVENRNGVFRCRIIDPERPTSCAARIINLAIHTALSDYVSCEHCEGTGEVSAPHYTKGGEIPDCDFVKCKHCNGTGERACE